MDIFGKNIRQHAAVVAEVGNNHEGSYSLAEELVGKAKEAGADAVKFQTYVPELFVSKTDAERFARMSKFALTFQQFEKLHHYAKQQGIHFFSTPLDLESARFLAGLCDVIKVSSGDNTFYPLLELVARLEKKLILSTGLATEDEIAKAKQTIEREWKDIGFSSELVLLHCITQYPVPLQAANLRAIPQLASKFNCLVGYSDHTLGIDACVHAVGFGARIVEKHFTISKTYSSFRDHQLSATPSELKGMIERIRLLEQMAGNGNIGVEEVEKENVLPVRRSIAAKHDMPQGHVLSTNDLIWIRPGSGLKPGQEHILVGKTLANSVSQHQLLTDEDVAGEVS